MFSDNNFTLVESYNGYEIGINDHSEYAVSRNITDSRYSRIAATTIDDAYETIDALKDMRDNMTKCSI